MTRMLQNISPYRYTSGFILSRLKLKVNKLAILPAQVQSFKRLLINTSKFDGRRIAKQLLRYFLSASVAIGLLACVADEQTELKQWMAQQRNKTPATIVPVVTPVAFIPSAYSQSGGSDPFDDQKLKNVLAKLKAASTKGATPPDVARKREPLEAFPLDGIKMTGFVIKQGKPTALVLASGTLYSVVAGQYLGQDFGKVAIVNEQEISIKETVQDASGVWAERMSKLPLNVVGKEIKK